MRCKIALERAYLMNLHFISFYILLQQGTISDNTINQ